LFSGDVSERVIKRLDVLGCLFAKLRKIQARILNMSTHRQIRTVDLQKKTAATMASYSNRMADRRRSPSPITRMGPV
jgi:hypothetical protein